MTTKTIGSWIHTIIAFFLTMSFLPKDSAGDSSGSGDFTPIWKYRLGKIKAILDRVKPEQYSQTSWSHCIWGHMSRDSYFEALGFKLKFMESPVGGMYSGPVFRSVEEDWAGACTVLGISEIFMKFLVGGARFCPPYMTNLEEAKYRVDLVVAFKTIYGDNDDAAWAKFTEMQFSNIRFIEILPILQMKIEEHSLAVA